LMQGYTEVAADIFLVKDWTKERFLAVDILWERQLNLRYGLDLRRFRSIIYDTIVATGKNKDDRIKFYCHRYVNALFDSVGQYFVIGTFWFPTGFAVSDVPSGWFGETLASQPEHFPLSPDVSYPQDVTIFEADGLKFGIDGVVAVRPKLDGVRFTVVDGWMYGLGVKCRLEPSYTPVQVLEWCDGRFYIVSPYAVPSHKVGVLEFCEHRFVHPSALDFDKLDEGLILLCKGVRQDVRGVDVDYYFEKRIKVKPTIEVTLKGRVDPWEVELDPATGIVTPRRPRPGRATRMLPEIRAYGSVSQLTRIFPDYEVQVKMSAGFLGHFARRGDSCLVIDSGYRLSAKGIAPISIDPIPASVPEPKKVGDVLWYDVNGRKFALPDTSPLRSKTWADYQYVTSAKLFLFHPKTQDYVVVQEYEGKYGLPGGRLEYGESSIAGLRREVREELGIVLAQEDDVRYVGTHTAEENGKVFHTFMYIAMMEYTVTGKEPHKVSYYRDVQSQCVSYVVSQQYKMGLLTGGRPLALLDHDDTSRYRGSVDPKKFMIKFKVNRTQLRSMLDQFKERGADRRSVSYVKPYYLVVRVIGFLVYVKTVGADFGSSASLYWCWQNSGIRLLDFVEVLAHCNDVCTMPSYPVYIAGEKCVGTGEAVLLPELVSE